MDKTIEVLVDGVVITSTSDESSALLTYATHMKKMLEDGSTEGKRSVELRSHSENGFIRITREAGKIVDQQPETQAVS